MAEKKYCPLKFTVNESGRACNEEKCAWWAENDKECILSRIAKELTNIASGLPGKWVGGAK